MRAHHLPSASQKIVHQPSKYYYTPKHEGKFWIKLTNYGFNSGKKGLDKLYVSNGFDSSMLHMFYIKFYQKLSVKTEQQVRKS